MGLWSTVKNFLNIGGVGVKLVDCTNPLSRTRPVVTGTVRLTSKSDKRVKSIDVKVIEEFTSGRGGREKDGNDRAGNLPRPGPQSGPGLSTGHQGGGDQGRDVFLRGRGEQALAGPQRGARGHR
jgi:hypothetical protein